MEKLYKHIIDQSVQKLMIQIYKDYGSKYDFSIEQIKEYNNNINITITQNKHNLKTDFIKKKLTHNNTHNKDDICQARVWGNAYMNTKHYRKHINKSIPLDPTTIGKKCSRKVLYDNIYCLQHLNKNTHGNFYLLPPNNKLSEYIQCNRHLI